MESLNFKYQTLFFNSNWYLRSHIPSYFNDLFMFLSIPLDCELFKDSDSVLLNFSHPGASAIPGLNLYGQDIFSLRPPCEGFSLVLTIEWNVALQ